MQSLMPNREQAGWSLIIVAIILQLLTAAAIFKIYNYQIYLINRASTVGGYSGYVTYEYKVDEFTYTTDSYYTPTFMNENVAKEAIQLSIKNLSRDTCITSINYTLLKDTINTK